jgi:hypothetical protein
VKVEFDKIGHGCEICTEKPKACGTCERNPNLLKLKDNFKRPSKTPPALPVKDNDRFLVNEQNRGMLGEWGIRPPPRPVQAPPPSQQESPRADPPAPDLGG